MPMIKNPEFRFRVFGLYSIQVCINEFLTFHIITVRHSIYTVMAGGLLAERKNYMATSGPDYSPN